MSSTTVVNPSTVAGPAPVPGGGPRTLDTPTGIPPAPNEGASLAPSSNAIALRTVRKFMRTPQLIVFSVVQGVLFLLIFRYVFGGAIGTGGLDYVDFLVPGFITTMVLFVGAGAASGVAEDVEHGFFDRLRSLPIPRTAVMAGRSLADTGLLTLNLAIATAVGFAVGFRLHADIPSALAAFGLCVLFGFAFEWVFIMMGLVAGNAQAAQGLSMLVIPFTFISSAYVPVATMPDWLRVVANNQPITMMVNAVRCLTQGPHAEALLHQSTAHFVVLSLVWTAGIIAVFAPLAIARFARTD
jgi:ABC transporter DrrB family efflux protein